MISGWIPYQGEVPNQCKRPVTSIISTPLDNYENEEPPQKLHHHKFVSIPDQNDPDFSVEDIL